MKILAGVCAILLVSLSESVSSPYLKFIPKWVKKSKDNVEQKWPPKFCNGLACPKYKLIKDVKDEYQIRAYEQSKWVSTNVAGVDYASASREMFGRLFQYISGANEERKKIDMTAPVITRIIPGQGPACTSNFTMSFYVNIDDPPSPTDSKVFLQTFNPLKAFVRSFGGYDMESIKPWLEEAAKLANFLKNDTLSYNDDYYYIGGYDSPFKFLNRHNEVWFLAM